MTVVVLTGGVGGAKLVDGAVRVLPPGQVTAIVNTADDFEHLGLSISPDLDSVFYMLAGMADPVRGWGVRDETWNFMDAIRAMGGEDWFNLGDRDLAVHVLRTQALRAGRTLTQFTAELAASRLLSANLLPMTDSKVATQVDCTLGLLPFQHYFVKHQCRPEIHAIAFAGADDAAASTSVLAALADEELEAVLIAPSNPYLSIDPILAVPGIRAALQDVAVPVVAVSPLIGGRSIKGPTDKIMAELGIPSTNVAICEHYAGLIDGIVIDHTDSAKGLSVPHACESTLMKTGGDRVRVAEAAIAFARTLS